MNMKNNILGAFAVLVAIATLCAEAKTKIDYTPEEKAARKAAAKEAMLKKTGGIIIKPDTRKGVIAFINTQNRLAETNICFVIDALASKTRYDIRYIKADKGDPLSLKTGFKADVAVILTDDNVTPSLVVAPFERYAVINTAKLSENLLSKDAKDKFYESRGRKQLLRAYAMVCGAFMSQYPGNALEAATVSDLDICSESLPADILGKNQAYLKKIGVEPAQRKLYSIACREGWAPAPTNEYQKAIWEQVKADKERGPTNPLKIPMPKRK